MFHHRRLTLVVYGFIQQYDEFNPAEFKLSIPTADSKLINLFMLATTNTRTLLDAEKIQHMINVYNKIK